MSALHASTTAANRRKRGEKGGAEEEDEDDDDELRGSKRSKAGQEDKPVSRQRVSSRGRGGERRPWMTDACARREAGKWVLPHHDMVQQKLTRVLPRVVRW